jgi:hypothetical protein
MRHPVTRRHEAPDNGNQEKIMIERRTLLSTIALCTLVLFATTAAGYVAPAFADKGSSHDGGGNDDGGNSGRGGSDDSGNSGRGGSDDSDDSDNSNSGSGSSGRGGSDDPADHDANDDNGNDINDAPDDSDGRDDNARDDSVDDNPGASTRNRGGRNCAAGTNCAKG